MRALRSSPLQRGESSPPVSCCRILANMGEGAIRLMAAFWAKLPASEQADFLECAVESAHFFAPYAELLHRMGSEENCKAKEFANRLLAKILVAI